MYAKAIRQRWPINDDMKLKILQTLSAVLDDPSSSPRERVSAAKALADIERQNQTDEHKLIDRQQSIRNDQLDAIASDLGIDPKLIASEK